MKETALKELEEARKQVDAMDIRADGDFIVDNHDDVLFRVIDDPAMAKFIELAFESTPSLVAEVRRQQFALAETVAALKAAKAYLLYSSKSKENRQLRAQIQKALFSACTNDHSKNDPCLECGFFTMEEAKEPK